jgi:hypothetical protein
LLSAYDRTGRATRAPALSRTVRADLSAALNAGYQATTAPRQRKVRHVRQGLADVLKAAKVLQSTGCQR